MGVQAEVEGELWLGEVVVRIGSEVCKHVGSGQDGEEGTSIPEVDNQQVAEVGDARIPGVENADEVWRRLESRAVRKT